MNGLEHRSNVLTFRNGKTLKRSYRAGNKTFQTDPKVLCSLFVARLHDLFQGNSTGIIDG